MVHYLSHEAENGSYIWNIIAVAYDEMLIEHLKSCLSPVWQHKLISNHHVEHLKCA